MKKQYTIPTILCVSTKCEPLMTASGSLNNFNSTPTFDLNKPATETEVTSKHHTLWDTTWDETDEDDE